MIYFVLFVIKTPNTELITPNYFLIERQTCKGDNRLGIRSEGLTVFQKSTLLGLHRLEQGVDGGKTADSSSISFLRDRRKEALPDRTSPHVPALSDPLPRRIRKSYSPIPSGSPN